MACIDFLVRRKKYMWKAKVELVATAVVTTAIIEKW